MSAARPRRAVLLALSALVALPCAAARAAPFNDDYAGRVAIAVGGVDTRSNAAAGIEPAESLTVNDARNQGCGTDGTARPGAVRLERTLWWEFTGNGGPVTISTAGSTFDTILAVYDVRDGALVGCHDDVGKAVASDRRMSSELTRQTVAGRAYAVQVGGCVAYFPICTPPSGGEVTLRVSAAPPYDDRAAATPVPASLLVAATNTGATLQSGEVSACGGSRLGKTVWFRYTAPAAGTAAFAVSGINRSWRSTAGMRRRRCAATTTRSRASRGRRACPRASPPSPRSPSCPATT